MNKALRHILKWLIRIIVGLAGLLLLTILLFYLFRGKITEKALVYVNDLQPGTVMVGEVQLRPFLNFPYVSLRLNDFQYQAPGLDGEAMDTVPVLAFENVYVSLDAVLALKGMYEVSEIQLGSGVINYRVEKDSVSNLERALGSLLNPEPETDSSLEASPLQLDLKLLQVQDLAVHFTDIPSDAEVLIQLHDLESGFSYYPDQVIANLSLSAEIVSAHFSELKIDKPKSVSFSSALEFDQLEQNIALEKSILDLSDALFEVEGNVDIGNQLLNLDFSAVNTGIELLNFLLSGVLNLDAIEQIGDGQIRLNGTASGSFKDQLPLMQVQVEATDMAFRVHTIDQSVTGISMKGYMTNGKKKDLSEAMVQLDHFHADFPEGSLDGSALLSNMVRPYAEISINADADLSLINEFIRSESVKGMYGFLHASGDINGSVNKKTGEFLDSTGTLEVGLNDVGFDLPGHQVRDLSGSFTFQEKMIGIQELDLKLDSSRLQISGTMENLLPWILKFEEDPLFRMTVYSDNLLIGKILGDSSFVDPITDLYLDVSLAADGIELRRALEEKRIPGSTIEINDLRGTWPGYAPLRDGRMLLQTGPDTLQISGLHAQIGQSGFDLNAVMKNYNGLLAKDSSANLQLTFDLTSDRLRAKDLLYFKDTFNLLPSEFAQEEILDLKFKGKVTTTVYELLQDSILPDFNFLLEHAGWRLKEYPDAFENLSLDVEHRDSLMLIRQFKGSIGESDFALNASLFHLLDSTKVLMGNVEIGSGLMDLDRLMAYSLLMPSKSSSVHDDSLQGEPENLSSIDLPDLEIQADIGELRFEENVLKNIRGKMMTRSYKIIYFDQFMVQSRNGGSIVLNGQFNISDPGLYMLSANIDIDTVNVNDFNLQIAIEDTIYSLEDNFNGILSADGLAELYLNPDFSINTDYSTAMFNVLLTNGRVQHFTPLQALARYTGNKDLDNIRFGQLRNSFTLMNGAVQIPLMTIESTLGLILLEGEQYLNGDFLYLARAPVSLVRGTAWNMLTNPQGKQSEEEEVQQMRYQKFMLLTISSKNGLEDVKVGDRRDLFK